MHAYLHGEFDDVADSDVSSIRLVYCRYIRIERKLGLGAIVTQLGAPGCV
jgi:hypothetical protein